MAERLSRRQFLGVTGAVATVTAVAGCAPLVEAWATVTPRPTRTPLPTEIPYPDLISGTNENIPTNIPNISIVTRQVVIEDATTVLTDQARSDISTWLPRDGDKDWFADITRYYEGELYTYFDSRDQPLYFGFGPQGKDHEMLNWQRAWVSRHGASYIFSDISGKFGYPIQGEDLGGKHQEAFVFVDIPNSKKTVIRYKNMVDSGGFSFEFDVSNDGNVLAINQVQSSDNSDKGVYLLDTKDWKQLGFIHEHVNSLQVSEDGSLIYSASGPRFSSKLIDATTGEVELIDWESQGVGYNPSRANWRYDVLSPNFEYISSKVWYFHSGWGVGKDYSEFLYEIVKTPTGFVKLARDHSSPIKKITNDGVVHYFNGAAVNLPE